MTQQHKIRLEGHTTDTIIPDFYTAEKSDLPAFRAKLLKIADEAAKSNTIRVETLLNHLQYSSHHFPEIKQALQIALTMYVEDIKCLTELEGKTLIMKWFYQILED